MVGTDLTLDFRDLSTVRVASKADPGELRGFLTPTALRDVAGYAYVQPGARIRDMCVAAKRKGLAPFVLGGSSGQTVIGAVSTSTHGAAFDLHPLPEYVDAVHVISGVGDVWIERPVPYGPIGDAALEQQLQLSPGQLTRYRDQALLDAALVALGAGGVIAGALVRLRKGEALINERLYSRIPWETTVRPALASGGCFTAVPGESKSPAGQYREFEVILDPYPNPAEAYVCARNEAPAGTATPMPVVRQEPNVLAFAVKIGGNFANYSAALAELVEASRLRGRAPGGGWEYHQYIDVVDAGVPTSQPVHSFELVWEIEPSGTPTFLQFVDECIDDVRAARDRGEPYLGLITIRFSRGTSAMLGMQYTSSPSAPRFAHVEISPIQDVLNRRRRMPLQNASFLSRVFSLPAAQKSRLHWGQGEFGPLRFDCRRDYPRLPEWRAAIGKLVGAHGNAFQTAFTRAVGAVP